MVRFGPPASRQARREWWRRQIQRQKEGRRTVAEFCRRLGVSTVTFYAWKRRLAAAAAAPADGPVPPDTDHGPRLLPVRLAAPDRAVELVLPRGVVLRLPPGCDLAFVRALLDALGAPPC